MITILLQAGLAYDPTFESLDSRPFPDYWNDLKFGLFIHWGPYSVPAWSRKGSYEEWYQMWLNSKHTASNPDPVSPEVWEHHNRVWGENFSYYNFGDLLLCEDFRAEDWARTFTEGGVKYIIVTSKHHDGFAMYPSNVTNNAWERNWTIATAGAKRDVLMELKKALAKTDVHFGLYYSLLEWYNPVLARNQQEYIDQHMQVQLRQIINLYQPDILWPDGQWKFNSTFSKSKQFIAWLYTDSPVKDKIAIGGRWGTDMNDDTGPYVGNYLQFEYNLGVNVTRPWEECIGSGISFGLNRNQEDWDVSTATVLLLNLIDRVSEGGNMLLGVAPDSRGQLSHIHQNRLRTMGKWLKINGEAIYGTRRHNITCQWSAGKQLSIDDFRRQYSLQYVTNEYILKITTDLDEGFGGKELYFTKKGDVIYAIMPKWSKTITLKNQRFVNRKITFLETGESLKFDASTPDTIITLPQYDPNVIMSRDIYVVKIA